MPKRVYPPTDTPTEEVMEDHLRTEKELEKSFQHRQTISKIPYIKVTKKDMKRLNFDIKVDPKKTVPKIWYEGIIANYLITLNVKTGECISTRIVDYPTDESFYGSSIAELAAAAQKTMNRDMADMLSGKVREPKSRWQAIKDFFNQKL